MVRGNVTVRVAQYYEGRDMKITYIVNTVTFITPKKLSKMEALFNKLKELVGKDGNIEHVEISRVLKQFFKVSNFNFDIEFEDIIKTDIDALSGINPYMHKWITVLEFTIQPKHLPDHVSVSILKHELWDVMEEKDVTKPYMFEIRFYTRGYSFGYFMLLKPSELKKLYREYQEQIMRKYRARAQVA